MLLLNNVSAPWILNSYFCRPQTTSSSLPIDDEPDPVRPRLAAVELGLPVTRCLCCLLPRRL